MKGHFVQTSGNNTLNGNQTINGTVATAGASSGFFGNGSGLTNLNPASLSAGTAGINTAGNAASATTAGTALTAATATSASQLGGIAAAKYARLDLANSFAGNQTVTGTASVSGAVTAGTLAIGGGTPITEHLSKTFSVTVPLISPNSCSTLTSLSLPGASDGDTIALGVPGALVAGTSGDVLQFFGYVVSGGNAVSIRVCNPHGGSASKSVSGSIRVDIWKH